ncbi:hypothetical protein CCYA_CCYA15G3942 [Cyanidiococcus yangmingshanensis]|nr:hypothetical protein CCYA_CCYA15G3942 [Cyanidiococcus yangmingshanensis]
MLQKGALILRSRNLTWLSGFIIALLLTQVWLNQRQAQPYMDELYHFPAANAFCSGMPGGVGKGNYTFVDWARITTPPGSYLFGCLPCWLWQGAKRESCPLWLWRVLLGTLPLTLVARELLSMPHVSPLDASILCTFLPLFFAGQLCYTDCLALWWYVRAWRKQLGQRPRAPWQSSVCGLLATATRQSYVIWHAFLGWVALMRSEGSERVEVVVAHGTAGTIYGLFFLWRLVVQKKGVYFGDSERHEPAWHWSNCLYCSAVWFTCAGGWRIMAPSGTTRFPAPIACRRFARGLKQYWSRILILFVCVTIALLKGTYVHPFVLADNRHYVFYFFRYFILPNRWRRFLFLPIYVLSTSSWWRRIQSAAKSERIAISLATILTLVPCRLVEMRYFIPPVMTTEILTSKERKRSADIAAMLLNLLLTIVCLGIFLEKPFERPSDLHICDPSPGRFMP